MLTSVIFTLVSLGTVAQVQLQGGFRAGGRVSAEAQGSAQTTGNGAAAASGSASGAASGSASGSFRLGAPSKTLGPTEPPPGPPPSPVDEFPSPTPGLPGGSFVPKYAGPTPGGDAKNPLPPPKADPPQLVWTGFRMAGEKSQLFLQTTRAVPFEVGPVAANGLSVSVLLRNCRVYLRNNRRNLDTRFFATPVATVRARQRREDVELTLVLKEPATASPRVEPGPDGTQFLVLEFPSGRPVPATTPANVESNAAPRP